ncbi:MAG: glycerol-3-phosphate acyltransferase [Ignavibacteria bacterium]
MPLILICVLFYLIGSVPTAYLIVKLRYKKNIVTEGSGNVGARNTLEVTNSKTDAIIVLIADFLKGAVPVFCFLKFSMHDPRLVLFPSLFLLAGHNYSVWLKFKGGRGLATAAGIMAVINFTLVIIWLIFYFVLNRFIKNVHISTVIALIILPLSVVLFQNFILRFNNPYITGPDDQFPFLFSFCSSIIIIILLKHIHPLIGIYQKRNPDH